MTAVNFTDSPSNGDTFTSNGVTFTYSTAKGRWKAAGVSTASLTTEEVQDITGAMFTGNTETGITATYEDGDGTIDLVVSAAASADTLTTARTIGGVSFDGSADINLPGVNAIGTQNTSGSAATLTTARTIGGVSFDGSADINLPGVNAVGTQNTSGSAATLTTPRTIGGVSFDGSANISLPSGSATILADMAALIALTGMTVGQTALVSALNKVFMYTSSGWYLIATMTNASPSAISGVNATYDLALDGTPTVVTVASTDPEGFPLTFSYAVTTGSLGSTATVVQGTGSNTNVFTITPSTVASNAGTFSLTFSVTDGASGAVSAVSAFSLVFFSAAITAVAGAATSGVVGDYNYWYSSHASTSDANNYMELTVTPGKKFWIGMIGAAGSGTGNQNSGTSTMTGGRPAYSNMEVVVPSGVTTMTVWTGAGGNTIVGGRTQTETGDADYYHVGGVTGGGRSGYCTGSSYTSNGMTSGGGLVGLFAGAFAGGPQISNAVGVIGSGGGAGNTIALNPQGGYGGCFGAGVDRGGDGRWNINDTAGSQSSSHGGGGTATAGGARDASSGSSGYRYAGTNPTGTGWAASTAGSALTGGNGGDSKYDGGGGGGAGYYGGGGGIGGGGYGGGAGGGGSAYINTAIASIDDSSYNKAGKAIASNNLSTPQQQVVKWAHNKMGLGYTTSHASTSLSVTSHGKEGAGTGTGTARDGHAGWAVVICANAYIMPEWASSNTIPYIGSVNSSLGKTYFAVPVSSASPGGEWHYQNGNSGSWTTNDAGFQGSIVNVADGFTHDGDTYYYYAKSSGWSTGNTSYNMKYTAPATNMSNYAAVTNETQAPANNAGNFTIT